MTAIYRKVPPVPGQWGVRYQGASGKWYWLGDSGSWWSQWWRCLRFQRRWPDRVFRMERVR